MALAPAQVRRLLVMVARLEPKVQAAFIAAIGQAATAVDVAALEAALRSGNIDAAMATLTLDDKALFPFTEELRNSYLAGISNAQRNLPFAVQANFGFGGNPRAVQAVRTLVTKITGEITEKIARGDDPCQKPNAPTMPST